MSPILFQKQPLLLALSLCLACVAGAQTKKYAIKPGLQALVQHAEGSNTLQVLLPGVDAIDLDLSQPASQSFQIKTADFNFDGYKDFALTSRDPEDPYAPTVFDIYLYNPEEKSFETPEYPDGGVCNRFSNVRLRVADKTLLSTCREGSKASVDVLQWQTPYQLELKSSVDHSKAQEQERSEEKAEQKADKQDARREAREARQQQRQESKEDRDADDGE